MLCLVNSVLSILHYFQKYHTEKSVHESIKKIHNNSNEFIEDTVVEKILLHYGLEPNSFMGTIFMPLPYLLCNGKTWIVILPQKNKKLKIENITDNKKSRTLSHQATMIYLKNNKFFGGFFITKQFS